MGRVSSWVLSTPILFMRISILTVLLVLLSLPSFASPTDRTISGFVEDSVSKETLVGATVRVAKTKLGAYTNKAGYFVINNVSPGTHTIEISALGYERKSIEVVVPPSGLTLRIAMHESTVLKEQVTVQADRENEKRQISISRVDIPVKQLAQIRVGGEADLFRALQMLPGVLTSSQISSGLYIRGGSPDQNLVLLDGMTVYNPTHLFGFISAFNTEAVKDVELLKGGFPAEFGGRMSAVLNVTQKDGNRDHVEGLVGLGLISSKASVQGPLGNGSWFIGGRRTYLDLLLGLLPEDPENPYPNFNFYDVNAKLTQNFGDNDKLSISGFLTNDLLTLEQPGIRFEVGIGNQASSLNWTHIFDANLFMQTTVSGSRYKNGFSGNQSGFKFSIENSIIDYTLKTFVEWYATGDLTLKAGYEGTIYNFIYDQQTGSQNDASGGKGGIRIEGNDNVHGVFAQANWLVTDRLSLQSGIRGNYWNVSGLTTFDPRLAARMQLTDGLAVKAAWGQFHQYLRLASFPDFSFFDTWLPTDTTVPAARADHYIVAVETQPLEGLTLNVDVYYKRMFNLNELRFRQAQASTVSDVFYIGNGESYGAELFIQRKMGRLTGWLGYGLGFVYAQFDSVNQGARFRPKYDRRHDFKVNALYSLSDEWEIGATFTYQSGQSYTGATSQMAGSMPDWEGGLVMVYPSQRWGLRLPGSHQLNLNVNYSTTLWDLPFRFFLDIYNVYSRRDIWFRYYDTSKPVTTVTDVRLLPILPTISVEVRFK